ncbi:hypothetical protein FV228_10310 [Methylobacterium sp. WL18]|nr:hypothetical protein FV233_05920 [Methylobacterium sp. WL7]TXN72011.1 hypothetical protein FV228_10310 [Methylobacterium sp. WL18]
MFRHRTDRTARSDPVRSGFPSRPHPDLIAPSGLEGALQMARRSREDSSEASASLRHLRIRER